MLKLAIYTSQESEVLTIQEALRAVATVAQVVSASPADLRIANGRERFENFARNADVVLLHLMGGQQAYPGFDTFIRSVCCQVAIVAGAGERAEIAPFVTVSADVMRRAQDYVLHGGTANWRNLILYLAAAVTGAEVRYAPPVPLPWQGVYHPDLPEVYTIEEYLRARYQPGQPTVAVWFHRNNWVNANTAYVDAIIAEVEAQGANVLPIFMMMAADPSTGSIGGRGICEQFLRRPGGDVLQPDRGADEARADVIINTISMSLLLCQQGAAADPSAWAKGAYNYLAEAGIPVVQALITTLTPQEWSDSPQGITTAEVCYSVAQPEYDGSLVTVPVAGRERLGPDPLTQGTAIHYVPIAERTAKLVRLAINWGKLRRKPNADKRVAIVFHNYPPRNDRIGSAFGLDTPASVWNILRDMKAAGYSLDLPENGKAIIDRMIAGLTNDRNWLSAEEMAARALDFVAYDQYMAWFDELPVGVRGWLKQAWGDPPGDLFRFGDRLLISGMITGNVFIGVQPPRGFLENPEAIYHSPDYPFPHHYYAYYRWIRDVFRADVVIHVGKHGSLEWLPGKALGLSAACLPDIAISDLPNVYPYIINDPGEGTQAKRRSYCCILDHLVPVMHDADLYGAMGEVEVAIREYRDAVAQDPGRAERLRQTIWEKVLSANLDRDLVLSPEGSAAECPTDPRAFDALVERVADYIYEMADTLIRDGLHIFGEPPVGDRLDEFVASLTRLPNGLVPSLRRCLARVQGYDLDALLDNRGKVLPDGRTGGDVIAELTETAVRLAAELRQGDLSPAAVESAMALATAGRSIDEATLADLRAVLVYMAGCLIPRIGQTAEELEHALAACAGHYVPSGPSGAPTRGMADILPTGRNFYSVDPQAIPSPSAWEGGIRLGDSLLQRYQEEEGKLPESIGIVLWGSPTMRDQGEDVAEILYLMGVRPLWEAASGRVTGVEIMPQEQLGHPRIDVTVRASGFFRDAFPNVMELIDEAVHLVANLDEPDDVNYLARHVREEVAQKEAEGLDMERALRQACYRVFSDRPGTYGAGVSHAIDAHHWNDEQDLGQVYVTWGGFAYGTGIYGQDAREQFRARLGRLDLTVKNEDSREYDMLDSDDFYSYHGGMIAAVKAFSGTAPRSYSGDASDPTRLKTRSTAEETKHIFRARILNPKWIESMKRHGYKGAGDMSRMVDIVFGWDATAEVVEDWMYESLARTYPLNEDMQRWLEEVNPFALHNMAERLLEAVDRGLWNASEDTKRELRNIYLRVEGLLESAAPAAR